MGRTARCADRGRIRGGLVGPGRADRGRVPRERSDSHRAGGDRRARPGGRVQESTRLHSPPQCHAHRLDGDDRTRRPDPDPGPGARPDAVQGDHRQRKPGRQRPDGARRARHGLERYCGWRLDAVLRHRSAGIRHVRIRRRHHPHDLERRPQRPGERARRTRRATRLDLGRPGGSRASAATARPMPRPF